MFDTFPTKTNLIKNPLDAISFDQKNICQAQKLSTLSLEISEWWIYHTRRKELK